MKVYDQIFNKLLQEIYLEEIKSLIKEAEETGDVLFIIEAIKWHTNVIAYEKDEKKRLKLLGSFNNLMDKFLDLLGDDSNV